ncbi:MAG: hypothetical protein MJZ12_00310 [Prevotella sp.]|nr:hypothetical protein [Prevotella sp.]
MAERLIKRKITRSEADSVKTRKQGLIDNNKDPRLLEYAERIWNSLEDVRRARARNNRYVYGDQLGDTITIYQDGEPVSMTMREYMAVEGNIPLQANMLKSQVDTLVGVLVKEQNEPVCNARVREEQQFGEILTEGLQANMNKNRIDKVYKLCALDLIIGGYAAIHEDWGYREGDRRREDSWTKYIDPNYLILETSFRDPSFRDISMIGCWYGMSFSELIAQFVKNPGDYEKLKKIYSEQSNQFDIADSTQLTDMGELDNIMFMKPRKRNECCVAEIWTLETKRRIRVHDWNEGTLEYLEAEDKEELARIKRINAERTKLAKTMGFSADEIPLIETEEFVDTYWYCRMLAPDGTILYEGESQLADRSHPFTIMVTPFVDGRISGYISDGIDLQDVMNRSLILQDWIVRNQVKGFTMIPQQLVPDGMKNEQFVQNAIRIGNYMFYDAEKARGLKPEVFHAGAVNYDATNYIQMIRQLMEASTSVSGAIQGKTPYSGTSAALYAQQTSNASTPIASLLSDIRQFMEESATKKAKNLAKFYDGRRWSEIAGTVDSIFDNANLDLSSVEDIEFDVKIEESSATPVYRAIANDWLFSLFNAGAISLEELLENSTIPFADKLLQSRQARQAETEAAQSGEMGTMAQQQVAPIENPVQTEGYGLPVQSTRPIVQ